MTSLRTRPTRSAVRILDPLKDFLATQAAGGLMLVVAAIAALVVANSPLKDAYNDLWDSVASVGIAGHTLSMDLRHWVNDGLMTLFFFVVGLEIKRELVEGELTDRRKAALPAVAALGGMVVPAAIFALINTGGAGARGWGVPMATDIAMALGVLALLGSRISPSLKLFLLALAIVDDIGAILVIAVFYSKGIDLTMLLAAATLVAAVVVVRFFGVRHVGVYVTLGTALWLATHEAGIHATIAGVVLGLLAPTKPFAPMEFQDADVLADVSSLHAARETVQMARESVSVVEWLEHLLHPWTSYVIVPLFAFANAGISLNSDAVSDALTSRVTLGVVAGLVGGKIVGITLASALAVRSGVAVLPEDVSWSSVVGVAALAGMGFTVSLFVASLAFTDPAVEAQAKLGILAATVIAGVLGAGLLRRTPRQEPVPSTR